MLWYVDTSTDPQGIYECIFLVASPDYEYSRRSIVGTGGSFGNRKSSCLGKGCDTIGEDRASYVVVGGAHRGSSPQNFMSR